jgi:hypothetical protein
MPNARHDPIMFPSLLSCDVPEHYALDPLSFPADHHRPGPPARLRIGAPAHASAPARHASQTLQVQFCEETDAALPEELLVMGMGARTAAI